MWLTASPNNPHEITRNRSYLEIYSCKLHITMYKIPVVDQVVCCLEPVKKSWQWALTTAHFSFFPWPTQWFSSVSYRMINDSFKASGTRKINNPGLRWNHSPFYKTLIYASLSLAVNIALIHSSVKTGALLASLVLFLSPETQDLYSIHKL